MSRNNLMMIDLEGVNNALNKQELTRINLSDNQLTEFGVPDNRTLVDLNLAGNSLTELSCATPTICVASTCRATLWPQST